MKELLAQIDAALLAGASKRFRKAAAIVGSVQKVIGDLPEDLPVVSLKLVLWNLGEIPESWDIAKYAFPVLL